ncbi:cytochrome P450 [Lentinus tigrinus ALCF2SS1-7]|uniref:Cytochrome P450 n=1 Tax=Lentinus tigrinus ALCF2SS1-6 TaxID=1328759 RepID=A0A5C2RVU6_9APHY|nr:cytochrome P450 [Lentinus tigrinus ALCF2SS1-6]RPD71335.1 cytochrome P450 [Lentinus tigrinus ALCF2SS1-7]
MILFQLALVPLAVALYGVLWLLWRYFRSVFIRTPLDNVRGPPPQSFVQGNLIQIFERHASDFHRYLEQDFGPVSTLHGLFGSKWLHIYDPRAMHSIAVKDRDAYEEVPFFREGNQVMFGPGLIATIGDHHRKQRKMLNPVFSASHMRNLTPVFYEITNKMKSTVTNLLRDGPAELDVLTWMSRTALELVGQGGMGHSFDSLNEKPEKHGELMRDLVPYTTKLVVPLMFLPSISSVTTPSFRRRVVEMIPFKSAQHVREIIDDLYATSKSVFNAKKSALTGGDEKTKHDVSEGRDIMSVLLKANMAASEGDRLPDEELIAQMSTLIYAGMDTTSNAMTRLLQKLAEHPDVQEKLRQEVIDAQNGQDMGYDELQQLQYLDAVCRETLRLYPPVPFVCRELDMILPLSQAIRGVDGQMMSQVHVPKGTTVVVDLQASNRNPALWGEDAYEWKPERWLAPVPQALEDANIPGVYSHLMTFFGGQRSCLGFKFSQLEMKVLVSVLLSSFRFSLTGKPIVWNNSAITYPTIGTVSLKSELPLLVEKLEL